MTTYQDALPKFIGTRVKRREDPNLLTGAGKYVGDIQLDNMAYMVIVRSPFAHAKILSIDTSGASDMDGVVAVLTGEDINPHLSEALPMIAGPTPNYSEFHNPPRQALSTDKVRHVGDPVAVVVADDPYTAVDAAEVVFVDYEVLDAVTDPIAAAKGDDATIIHEDFGTNIAFKWEESGGDVDAAFAAAEVTVDLDIVNQRLIPMAMEPRTTVAAYHAETEEFTIWASTQIPHSIKDEVSAIFGLPADKFRVITPEVGGGFGAKSNVYNDEVLAPFMARHLGRPVKWVASRSEDYLTTNHGRDQIAKLRLAATKEGRIQAADLDTIADCGGYYSRVTPVIATLTGLMMTGVYDIPNGRTRATGVFTNKVPTEPYRGAGRPEAIYMMERVMDLLADKLNLDPVELRRLNYIAPDQFPYTTPTKAKYDSGEYARALDKAVELIDYQAVREEQAKRRQNGGKLLGIGFASYVEVCGFGPWESGQVIVDREAKVTVKTGSSPHGQGHHTAWSQIAAETLQIPMEDITVLHGDTKTVPRGVGTFGSRSAPVGGSAVLVNARTVRENAKELAGHLLEVAVEDIELINGSFQVRGVPESSITWKEVAKAAHSEDVPEAMQGSLDADEDFSPPGETFPFGTHAAVIEIDPDTGQVEIVRYVTVDDCGRVINPLLVEGQVHGGLAQGIGQALFEGAVYDEMGNLFSGTLMDYAMPKFHTLPSYETHRTETPSPLNPLGVKGIGEAATIGSTPTIVNAVVDALSHLSVEHVDMPLTSAKVWKVLQLAQ